MTKEDLAGLKIDKAAAFNRAPRRRKARFVAVAVVAAVIVLVLLLSGVFAGKVPIETVTVSLVYPSQTFTRLNASGYVVAQRKAAVASKATGRLVWLGVEEGSRVKTGEVLARLENSDVLATRDQAAANIVTARATLDQAKAELNDATLSFNRIQKLFADGIVSRADYDVAEARQKRAMAATAGAESAIRGAKAAYEGAAVAVEYTLIRAPFDAVVLTKNADVGDIVTPLGSAANAKAAVVTIADPASIQVEADVSEANLEKVRVGQPCEIQLDAFPEIRFRGVVHMVVPTADRSKATVLVKVRFLDRDPRVLPEMSAKVAFLERPVTPTESAPRTAVNPAAVATREGRSVVFVVQGDRVVATPVEVGGKIGEYVEIRSGVKAGQKVALKPLEKLKNNSRIAAAGEK